MKLTLVIVNIVYTLTVLSALPDVIQRPSGLNKTLVTASLWAYDDNTELSVLISTIYLPCRYIHNLSYASPKSLY